MHRRFLPVLALALVAVLLLSACGQQGAPTGQSEGKGPAAGAATIKIGFFAPETGPEAADGESAYNSAKLAVEQINAAGGVLGKQLELVNYDDQLDSKQAVSIAQKLTSKDGVVAVVSGSYSGPTRAAAPIFQQAKIPMIAGYAVHPDIPKAGDYIFQQSFSGVVQGRAAAEVAAKSLNAKTASILAVDIDFGKTIRTGFQERADKLGLKIVSSDTFKMGDKEFTPVLTRIKQAKPDVLFLVAYAAEGSQIVRQAHDLGLGAQLMGTEGIDSTVQFLQVVGNAGDGLVIVTNLNRDDANKQTQAYLKAYKDKFGYDPDMVGASVYDGFQLIVEGINRAKSADPAAIRKAVAEIKDFTTVTGPMYGYDQIGQALKPVAVQQVKNGAFHYFGEVTDKEILQPPLP